MQTIATPLLVLALRRARPRVEEGAKGATTNYFATQETVAENRALSRDVFLSKVSAQSVSLGTLA